MILNCALLCFLTLPNLGASPAGAPGGGDATVSAATEYLLRDLPGVPDDLRAAILAGETQRALRLVREVVDHDQERASFWLLIEAAIHQQAGAHADALRLLERAEAGAAATDPWRHKLRFARAASHRALGQWREVEALLEEETDRLRSAGRQTELAAVVLEFADASSTPVPGAPPTAPALDYARARALYREVLALETLDETREYAQWRVAQCSAELREWPEAIAAFQEWLRDWDPTAPGADPARYAARPGTRVPERLFEVRFQLGRALGNSGDYRSAERAFLELEAALLAFRGGTGPLIGRVPEPGLHRLELLEELRGEALFLAGQAAGKEGRIPQQIGAYARLLVQLPNHPRAAAAALGIGEAHAGQMRWEEALRAWDAFLASAPADLTHVMGVGLSQDEAVQDAAESRMRAEFRRADAIFALGRYEEAARAYERYAAAFPNGPDWGSAQEGVVRAEYEVGADRVRARDWPAARAAWSAFLARHPLHEGARSTYFALGELYLLEAQDLEAATATPLLEAAVRQWNDLAARWPRSEEASQALYFCGEVLEDRLGRLEEAVAAYRRCDFGSRQPDAQARLARMIEDDLSIATPRVWRTGEKTQITVDLRNLTELEIAIYPLDLEAYFRKHLTHAGVAELDLDLIAPAQSFRWQVPEARPYAPLSRAIDLPLEGHGAWAVAVTAADLRATTLVLRSDLDFLVKSSREELIVLAQDMRRLHAADGVRVLVAEPAAGADGAARVHELTTGSDGVARLNWKAAGIAPMEDLRVFAASALGAASTQLGLGGLGVAVGLFPRSHLITDRPLYRAGETVHWRAVVRGISGDHWSTAAGETWRVQLLDPRQRALHAATQDTSDFGTLAGEFTLAAHATPGEHVLRLTAPDGRTATHVFTVRSFDLPQAQLEVELGATVAFPGESVTGRVLARTWYGGPLPDAPLQLHLPDGRVLDLKTDADGAAIFTFETAGLDEGVHLDFRAIYVEAGIAAAAQCFLAPTGFRVAVQTRRPVALAGESITVEARAFGWDDAPRAEALQFVVSRRERTAGRVGITLNVPETWSERTVLERELRTDPVTGRVEFALQLEQEGEYRLRVRGEDRQRRPIEAVARLEVAGAADPQKLRFLTELTAVQVGAEAELLLHNGAGPGLALITFLGAGVLEHRVVHLAQGANRLRFAVRPDMWPNFAITADLLREREWHATQIGLRAGRAMHVSVQAAAETWTPGEEASVTIEARDHLGRPVQAEFALGIVDEALLALADGGMPALVEAFESGLLRQAEMRSAATSQFSYPGVTRFVAREILDEALAQASARAWAERRGEIAQQLSLDAKDVASGYYGFPMAAPAAPPAEMLELGYVSEAADAVSGGGGGVGGRYGGRGGKADRRPASAKLSDEVLSGQDAVEGGVDGALAFWDARVRTDAQGRATVTFRVPQRSTSWRILAQGVGPDTLLGEAARSQVAQADFQVELRSPSVLREGDAPRFGARLHNPSGLEGAADLTLEVTSAGRTWRVIGAVNFAAGARFAEAEFTPPADLNLTPGAPARVRVLAQGSVGGAEARASASRDLTILPWGIEHAVARAGRLTAEESFTLELPAGHDWRQVALTLQLGAGRDGLLLAETFGGSASSALHAPPLRANLAQASALIGACAVHAAAANGAPLAAGDRARLADRIAGLVADLTAAQADDGSWGVCAGAAGSLEATARAIWALAAARSVGHPVAAATLDGARSYAESALRRLATHELEETAMLQHALAEVGAGDFAVTNRLHRARNEMNSAALAYTTLALARLNSGPMAAEVAQVLAQRYVPGKGWSDVTVRGPHRGRVELTALALLALQASPLRAHPLTSGMDDLLAWRPWSEPSGRGLALAALAGRGAVAEEEQDCAVEVAIGDVRRTLRLTRGAALEPLVLPLADGAARVSVRLTLAGRGQPHFAAELMGFTREVSRMSTDVFEVAGHRLNAVPPRFAGREIPVGFGVLQRVDDAWENRVTQLPVGETLHGVVAWKRDWNSIATDRDADDLLLAIPLPAGGQIVPGSVFGSVEAWEVRDGVLWAWVGRARGGGELHYRLTGAVAGDWRIAPVTLRSAYAPARRATGEPGSLRVLPRGQRSEDPYRPTPDESFHLGRAYYQAGELEGAARHLQALVDAHERNLEEETLRATAEMLLHCGIAANDPPRIVRWFEVLREKSPDLTIPFEQVVIVGRAYRTLGEFERAALVFQAVLDETFGKDLRVAGVLEGQGDFAGAMNALYRLWLEYPTAPSTVSSALTLADRLLLAAPNAHTDPRLQRVGYDRAALIGAGVRVLRLFQTLHPSDPLAADAGLNLVSAFVHLEDYAAAANRAAEMAERWPEPRWADSFRYSEAVANWYLGRDGEARALLQRIAAARYVDEQGVERPSENRDLALYILGQIHHARQEFDLAAEHYRKVETVFADAREALAALRAKHLTLDEVHEFRPGEKVRVPLRHRNLGAAEVLVYPVDLMTLYLRERSLSGVTHVNLSGIEPTLQRSVKLAAAEGLRPRETELTLALEKPGAYLLMVRGDELHASALVLVSDVEIDVREDFVQGRLRIQAATRSRGEYLRDVDVRVIGSANANFVAGKTDPRGLFVADGIAGASTVIARSKDGHYAFFRGERPLGVAQDGMILGGLQQLEADDYFSNVFRYNADKQQSRAANYERELRKARTGVQVQQVQ